MCSRIISRAGFLLCHKITREESALAWQTRLLSAGNAKKITIFFSYQGWKPSALLKLCCLVLGTHPPTPACLEPLHRGISCHSSRHFSKRNVLPQGNCNPGKSLGTRTEGKQMGFQTIFFALSKGHWSGWAPSHQLSEQLVQDPPPSPSAGLHPCSLPWSCRNGGGFNFFSWQPFMKLYYL